MGNRITLGSICLFVLALSSGATASDSFDLSEPHEFYPEDGGPQAVELADIDLDGILDAVAVFPGTNRFACFRGVGDGTFAESIASGDLYLEPSDLVVDDFDGDGLPDIAAINNACT